jgi:hypothetical protein
VCVWCLVPVGKVGCELNYDAVSLGMARNDGWHASGVGGGCGGRVSGARARRARARRVGRAGARAWLQRARRRCLRRARERCPCRSAGKGKGMRRTACLRVCGARARVRACACARMCVLVRVSHVQELRPRCWLRTRALATHRPSMNLTYSFGWRPGIARGSPSARAAGTGVTTWHPEHPHSGLGRCLCPFSTARGNEVCALVAHLRMAARHRPGQPERACGWHWGHHMASRAPT